MTPSELRLLLDLYEGQPVEESSTLNLLVFNGLVYTENGQYKLTESGSERIDAALNSTVIFQGMTAYALPQDYYEEKCRVVLVGWGKSNRLNLISFLRTKLGLSAKEALDKVNNLPLLIEDTESYAKNYAKEFLELGFEVEIKIK